MSTIVNGKLINAEMTKNARGGTEMMRDRLLSNVDEHLLEGVAIHFSRVTDYQEDLKNVLYCHDTADDPANEHLANEGWNKFDKIVFVSAWQRDQYINAYGIPYRMCAVIPNAVEVHNEVIQKPLSGPIRLIYHTTPHRGLGILVPVVKELTKHFDIHLDVYSSFSIYGWDQRDEPFKPLFDEIKQHPNMTYHGAQPNDVVIEALKQAHVFVYPCIWTETSCIALIEAIKCGVVSIHPNLGALPETAEGNTITYDFHEDMHKHAQTVFDNTFAILSQESLRREVDSTNKLLSHTINYFTHSWNALLANL